MSSVLLQSCWSEALIKLCIIYIRNSLMLVFAVTFLNMFFNKRLILFNDFECWMWLNLLENDLTINALMIVNFVTTITNVCVLIFESRLTKNNLLIINFRDAPIFFSIKKTCLTMSLFTTFLRVSIICLYDYLSTRTYIYKKVRKYI